MPVAIDDVLEPTTFDEAKATIYDVLAAVGVPTSSWKPGAVVRTIISATAVMLAGASSLHSAIGKSSFLEKAQGIWADLVGENVYGTPRQLATFATGDVTLTNAGAGIFTFDPGDLALVNSTTGKTYLNAAFISLGASSSMTSEFHAVEAGSNSNALPGEIDTLAAPLTGVTCANAAAFQALDDEEDPPYKVRAKEKLGALSPMGPWDAYSYAAKNATRPDGTLVGVTKVRSTHDGAGAVTTYVASAAGPLTLTDLGYVDDAIQANAAPLGITATTDNATAVVVPVTAEFWIYNIVNMTDAQIIALVTARLEAFFAARPIGGDVISGGGGGKVYTTAIEATIGGTRPEIFRVILTAPAADVAITPNQIPTIGTVTLTVHQVLPGRDA
jgi:hypothetical protein